jgi:hypothetical protein
MTTGRTASTFRLPRAAPTFARMDREYWQKALSEAERELETATTRSGLNAAAKKLMRARQQLKLLEQTGSSRGRFSRASESGVSSS